MTTSPPLERPDAASSSSALGAPSEMSVAAEHASEERTEGLAGQAISFGTVNDKDQSDYPNWPGHSNEVSTPDQEVVDAVFSRENWFMVGDNRCPYLDVCRRSNGEPAILPRVIEHDEIKFEPPGSGSGYRKEERDDVKKERDDPEVFEHRVVLRESFSHYKKTQDCKDMNNVIEEEAIELLEKEEMEEEGKNTDFKTVVNNIPFTVLLPILLGQRGNKPLENGFEDIPCRNQKTVRKISNLGLNQWFIENYQPEILERRLDILRAAAKKWNPKRDIFLVVEIVTELNSKLHPQINEKNKVEMFTLATTISLRSLRSGGDTKI